MASRNPFWARVRIGDGPDSHAFAIEGRAAWALVCLIEKGERGCTPIDTPGPRWSDYVFKLRKLGIVVETITEKHGGTFSGHHARYVLRTPVTLLAMRDPRQNKMWVAA